VRVCVCMRVCVQLTRFVQQTQDHNDVLVAKGVELQRKADEIPAMRKQLETYKAAKCDAVRLRTICSRVALGIAMVD
jgi:hypothetical protein